MPDLVEQMYCSQQIFIPPNLPSILKKYAKAAIRTQPGDLLSWSSAYFRALAEGIPPPAKDRIEYPPVDTPSGLSPGFLKVLINQIGKRETVHKNILAERWKGVCLNANALQDLLDVGMFEDDVSWLEFLAICVGTLEPSLTRTMTELCELLTDEPEGGRAAIPVTIFLNLYKYLAKLDCGPVNRLEHYETSLKADSETQCQATDLKPTEEEKEPQEANIDWDTAIGSESPGDDPGEGIVVEAADTESDKNEQEENTGEQLEVADTEAISTEPGGAESEENGEANEEEVNKVEVTDDTSMISEDVGIAENDVSKESVEDTPEAVDSEKLVEAKEVQLDESTNLKVDETDPTIDEKREEPDNEAEDGVNEADDMDNGGSTGGDKEEMDENAVANENKSPLEDGDSEKFKEGTPTESGASINEAADETSPGNDEGNGIDDAEAVSQLAQDTVDLAVIDGSHGEEDKNGYDDQTTDNPEKDAGGTPANDAEGAKSKEADIDGENGDETAEPQDAADDTNDEKVGSITADETPVESLGEGEDIDETEEKVITSEGIEAQTAAEIDESVPGTNEESAERVQDEVDTPVVDGDTEAPNSDDANDKSADVPDVTLADEGFQAQADIDAAATNHSEDIEQETDVTKNQGEHEELPVDGTADGDAAATKHSEDAEQEDDVTKSQSEHEELAVDGTADGDAAATKDSEDAEQEDDVTKSQSEHEELAVDGTADGDAAATKDSEEAEQEDDVTKSQGEHEELAVDGTADQEEAAGAANDEQDAINATAKASSEDGNESENVETAADAVPEERGTAETSGKENVEQTAEDENGNENKPHQEMSILSIEETIDPKTAYIVNDDGTLSAPRAESVLDEDALKGRDSDISVYTKASDDGMMVWPDIKPQEKEEAEPELLLEKEVTSEDGIEVFTDIEMEPHQEEIKLLPEQQEEEQVEGENEENIFAPQIDSFTDLLEAESAPVEEANPEQLAAALESIELAAAESGVVVTSGMMTMDPPESDEAASQGPAEPATLLTAEAKSEEQDQKKAKKPRRKNKDVEIETLVKKDSDMMLVPTPITSDIMLYMDGACEKTAAKLSQTQQLSNKMSMVDVQVSVPVDETVVEVVHPYRYPKWMYIPGIGPTVPDQIIEEAEKYFLKISELQEGMVMPRNIRHFHCPPLELIPDCPEGIAEGI